MADILVVGSTGLIGGEFLELIKNNISYPDVIALSRRKIDSISGASNIKQLVIDFDRLDSYRNNLAAKTTFCALGTTIKKAGSKEKFRAVDYQLPLNIARIVLENRCENFIFVSAVGADADSKVFYNRVKGELETEIQKLPFKSIHILRPSLLLGKRDEFRVGEKLGEIFLSPVSKLVPFKYRPIHARDVAKKALDLLEENKKGVHIYEGAALHG